MKQSLIMFALCFPMCLARKENTPRIVSNKNSPSWRNPLQSALSFFQNANQVSPVNTNIKSKTKMPSKNRRISIAETNTVPSYSSESQPAERNFISSVRSMVQASMNLLLGRKNNKEEVVAKQQTRSKTYKHVYIIPTTPPQLQNDKFFHQGNTKAYQLRRTLRQTSKTLDPVDTKGGVNNILRNLYSGITCYVVELLSDKNKVFETFGNIFNIKASTYRRKTSHKTSPSYISVKKPTSRRTTVRA